MFYVPLYCKFREVALKILYNFKANYFNIPFRYSQVIRYFGTKDLYDLPESCKFSCCEAEIFSVRLKYSRDYPESEGSSSKIKGKSFME